MYTNLAGVDDLGCGLIIIPNGAAGEVMTIDPVTGLPAWLPNTGGVPSTTNTLAFVGGVLISTVNSVAAAVSLNGELQTDAFGVPLGYLLPL